MARLHRPRFVDPNTPPPTGATLDQVGDAIEAALAAERAAVTTPGAGLPCRVESAEHTGTGADAYASLILHAATTFVTGRRYRFDGTITLRDARDSTLLATRHVHDVELVRLALSPWWTAEAYGVSTPEADDADLDDWLAAPAHAPSLGWRDDTGAPAVSWRVRSDAPSDVAIAFVGTVADLGTHL
jgi:hypothetical protein